MSSVTDNAAKSKHSCACFLAHLCKSFCKNLDIELWGQRACTSCTSLGKYYQIALQSDVPVYTFTGKVGGFLFCKEILED